MQFEKQIIPEVLESTQDLHHSDKLRPLVLYRGNMSEHVARSMTNAVILGMKSGVGSLRELTKIISCDCDGRHCCGLHAPKSNFVLSNFMSRLIDRQSVSDNWPGLRQFCIEMRGDYVGLTRVSEISEYDSYTSRAWRMPRSARRGEISEHWPHIPDDSLEGAEMLKSVDEVVPKEMCKELREEICQDIIVDLLKGEITESDLKDRNKMKYYIRSNFKKFPRHNYATLSLDAPLGDSDGKFSLADTIIDSMHQNCFRHDEFDDRKEESIKNENRFDFEGWNEIIRV